MLPFIQLCLPITAPRPPGGDGWLHEIKHDGYRILTRREDESVRLITRTGDDWTERYPFIVDALTLLPVHSCLIDAEAVVCDAKGVAQFEMLRGREHDSEVFLYAFDLLEVNGKDLRADPIEERKRALTTLLRRSGPGLRLNGHLEADGQVIFPHACRMGLEGVVSKRRGSRYRSGRCLDWLQSRNPDGPAAQRLRRKPGESARALLDPQNAQLLAEVLEQT